MVNRAHRALLRHQLKAIRFAILADPVRREDLAIHRDVSAGLDELNSRDGHPDIENGVGRFESGGTQRTRKYHSFAIDIAKRGG